jgi:hypothetical protein
MQFFVRLILLALFSSTVAQAASPSMSSYWDCAKSIGIAINDKFTIIPGEQTGARGLYVYTHRSAFLLALAAPQLENHGARDYFLRSTLPDVGDIFIGFHEEKTGNPSDAQQGVSYQTTTPSLGTLGRYHFTPAKEAPDERAKAVLSKRLKARIETIKDYLDDKNSYSTPAEARVAFEKDRGIYREKLERCRLADDRELNWAVSGEVQKLDSGFPGVTIWEKEIGGKAPARRAR